MFDTLETFRRQFTPVEGGYLYYPSRKGGGKLVTNAECETLLFDWQRVAGTTGTWKSAAVLALAVLVWAVLATVLGLPPWADWIIFVAAAVGFGAWIFWFAFAPRRLVKSRPDVAPPRSSVEARRQARAAVAWPIVVVALLISGAIFFGHLAYTDTSFRWWAWTLGSGLVLFAYLWIAVQKLRDR